MRLKEMDALRLEVKDLIDAEEEEECVNKVGSFRFLSSSTLKRYLRARDGNVAKAAAMIRATVKWRKEILEKLSENRSSAFPARPVHLSLKVLHVPILQSSQAALLTEPPFKFAQWP